MGMKAHDDDPRGGETDASGPDGVARRRVLGRAAAGAGAATAAWAAPMISGLGIAPAHAEACTTPPAPPTWSCSPNTTPTCANGTTPISATASAITTTSTSGLIGGQVGQGQRSELSANPVGFSFGVTSCRPTALCPNGSGSYTLAYTFDRCTFFNQKLAAGKAGASANGATLTAFRLRLNNLTLTIGGSSVTFTNLDINSLSNQAACPETKTITLPVTVPDFPAITFDPVTCTYTCPTPTAPTVPPAFALQPVLTAQYIITTSINAVLTGSATTQCNLAGTGAVPPAPGSVPIPAVCT